MKRKYLEDLGVKDTWDTWGSKNDKRRKEWHEQRNIYGFDERETWSLNTTFLEWLYERLKMYMDSCDEFIDLTFHKFNYKGKEYTQREIILMMIEDLEFILVDKNEHWKNISTADKIEREKIRRTNRVLNMWKLVFQSMWW